MRLWNWNISFLTSYKFLSHTLETEKKASLLNSRACRITSTSAPQVLADRSSLDIQLEAEAEFARITCMGISDDSYFASMYSTKCSKYHVSPFSKVISIYPTKAFKCSTRIFTCSSKTEVDMAAVFWVYRVYSQTEFFAMKETICSAEQDSVS